MHIDPLATAIVSGIAIVGMAAVLRPKPRDLDAEGHVPDYERSPPSHMTDADFRREYETDFPAGAGSRVVGYAGEPLRKGDVVNFDPNAGPGQRIFRKPDPVTEPKADADVGSRYWVDDFAEVDGFHVEDRHTGLTCAPCYAHRKSALRAARRLNAKAELDAANGRLA